MKRGAWVKVSVAAVCGVALVLSVATGGCARQEAEPVEPAVDTPAEPQAEPVDAALAEEQADRVADAPAEAQTAQDAAPALAEEQEEKQSTETSSTVSAAKKKSFVGTSTGEGFPEASYLTADEVSDLVKDGEPFVAVDIRWPQTYAALHASGTVNIPESQLGARAGEIPAGQTVVLVADASCSLGTARQALLDAGVADEAIKALDGGMANIWSVYGMRMEASDVVESCCG